MDYSLLAFNGCTSNNTCRRSVAVDGMHVGGEGLAAALGCPIPPPEDCDTESCRACRPAGGAGAGCGAPLGAKGLSCNAGGLGAFMRYRAGGAGSDTAFPGTGGAIDWRTALGRNWSHDYAQRIVLNNPAEPDFETRIGNVWLITKAASFRRFTALAAGGGLRLYTTNSPSDEYRRLHYDTATAGWELHELDGTKHIFRSDGLWTQTFEPSNPTHPKTATYSGTQLQSVAFPDGRSETFTYHPSGKLASITEVAVVGSGTPSRVWTYIWSGDDLTLIGRPDGTVSEYTYAAPGLAGYLSQIRLIGTDGTSGRVIGGFEYNANGFLTSAWHGDPLSSGPNAVDLQTIAYTNLVLPTEVRATDALNVLTTYTVDRDPRSIKPRIKTIAGECTACGLTPNTTFEYNDPANPMRETALINARGFRTNYTYTAFGQMASRTEAVGTPEQRVTSWTYDANFPGLLTQVEQPSTTAGEFRRTQMVYHPTTTVMTPRTITGWEAGASFSYPTAMTYNGSGQALSIDPPGYGTADVTSFTYLVPGRNELIPDQRIDPIVGATLFGYDGYNRRTSVTDANGVETVTTYDPLNRVTEVRQKGATAPDDLVTTYEYGLFKDLMRVTLPRGNVIEYAYDTAGRMVTMDRKPNPATAAERTAHTLDDVGNRTLEELQRWDGAAFITDSKTEYVYSSRCHLDQVIRGKDSATPSTTEYCYDKNNNLEKTWDANHPSAGQTAPPTQQNTYDSLDRLITMTQPFGGAGGGNAATGYQYDPQDHLKTVTDAESNVTTYTTGDRDLMTQQVSPVSGTTTYGYNEHGQLTTETDARPVTVNRTVDVLDRVTLVDYTDNTLDTSFVYDGPSGVPTAFWKGRTKEITRNGQTIAYTYDRFGRLLQDGALAYEYDQNGNRTKITYPVGVVADYTHDFADREASLIVTGGGLGATTVASGAAYKASGPLSSLTLGNTILETRQFDARYFPDRIQAGALLDWDYTVDAIGNPTGISGTIAGVGYAPAFAYQDFQYFLTQGNGPWGNRTWTYDKIGNRLSFARSSEPTQTYAYASPGHNPKLSTITPSPGWGTGAWSFSYDAAGNQTSIAESNDEGAVQTTLYDFAGDSRMNAMRTASPTGPARTDVLYDGRGFLRQAHLTVTGSGDNLKATPLYSSAGMLMARTEERTWTGGEIGPDGEDQTFAWANTETTHLFYFAGRPVAQLTTPNPELLYLTTDHLGTPVLVTNGGGGTIWAGGLEPFGASWTAGLDRPDPEPTTSGGGGFRLATAPALSRLSMDKVFLRYPGQWSSDAFRVGAAQGDVYYNVNRWYQTQIGRYTQPDPLGVLGPGLVSSRRQIEQRFLGVRSYTFGSQSLRNWGVGLYSYAAGNPLALIDPLGLEPVTCSVFNIGLNSIGFGPNLQPTNKCLMVGACVGASGKTYLTGGQIQVLECFDCPDECTFNGETSRLWSTGGSRNWECLPWTPVLVVEP